MRFCVPLFALAFVFIRCSENPKNKFSDPTLLKIADLQDRRSVDSLQLFLLDESADYRKAAVLAFASVQDSATAPLLASILLEDENIEVKKWAAFALGQTGTFASTNALIPALQNQDHSLVKEVLEALGKTIRKEDINVLHKYEATDSLTQEGLALACYRLGQRNLSDSIIEKKVTVFLDSKYNTQIRITAANFFPRTKLAGKGYDELLIATAQNDSSPEVRMAAAQALRKMTKEKVLPAVEHILTNESDARVRVGAVRALSSFPIAETFALLKKALDDNDTNVAIAASEIIKPGAVPEIKSLIEGTLPAKNWRVQANLYEALLSVDPSDKNVRQIKVVYEKSPNDYEKAALLIALSKARSDPSFMTEELLKSKQPIIKSSAAQAIISLDTDKLDIKKREAFAKVYQQIIEDGDAAVIANVAATLADSTHGYRDIVKDYSFLQAAKAKLSLPKDYETIQPLDEAIAYFEKKPKPTPPKNTFNHPINWKLVKSISKNQQVIVKTTKGEIVLQLLVEEAPGSVANFVDLVNRKYFDGKIVHRVVPNFVIQTGCNRGDGYGSEDYSIRSEFSERKYTTGSVGMASAGKDTEGTQWFITHSPAPHLDGRYTIFATTRSDIEVVDKIEVGDRIISVSLKD